MRERIGVAAIILIAALGACLAGAVSGGAASTLSGPSPSPPSHYVSGIVQNVSGAKFSLEKRDKHSIQVDVSDAVKNGRVATVYEGLAVSVQGAIDKQGVLHAETVIRIKKDPAGWHDDN